MEEMESETFSALGTHDTTNYLDVGTRKIQFSVLFPSSKVVTEQKGSDEP